DQFPVIDASQPGVDVTLKQELVDWVPDIYVEVMFAIMSQFWPIRLLLQRTKAYKLFLEAQRRNSGSALSVQSASQISRAEQEVKRLENYKPLQY
ncbi:MAG TPA: hypothetical protein VEC99_11165, partial [Clostridia bacterium]|nr:hypothetical protein [Clostridia bacterium]